MNARRQYANAIRVLAMDAVQKANSGHPGMPMGMADIAEVLWRDFLRYNPKNPNWFNRDRFVLSNGHGAMLLYAVLHLTGYDLSIEDLKQFRQLHSKTPGHPEFSDTPGVETTTGPLGQGLANAVGMAIAEQMLAAHFNQKDFKIVDHYTYAFVGDGDLMEGISHEACSLAGTFGLEKLIVIYDDNGISIDGDVANWFTDNTPERFAAYHWHVIPAVDGHDAEAVAQAIAKAQAVTDKPSLICCQTKIGYGSPNLAGSEKTHGSPLGEDEVALVRQELGWEHPPFEIPADIYQAWDHRQQGEQLEAQWNKTFARYESQYPELAAEFLRRQHGHLPSNWSGIIEQLQQQALTQTKAEATRKSSLQCLNALIPHLPEIVGGSADLSGSNCTLWKDAKLFTKDNPKGHYIEYGVREFAMSAIMNGMALHAGIIPFAGTFLTFTDYARNAVRLSALMQQRVIFVYSHDSIGLGEDGPTHQPIEQATMLRLTPNLHVWRPCDFVETTVAWQAALERQKGPSCILLTRQNVEQQPHSLDHVAEIRRGAYVLYQSQTDMNSLDGIFIATGSEVEIAMSAAKELTTEGLNIRVVSMPCVEVFLAQEQSYRDTILPPQVINRIAIEAGVPTLWYQFVGPYGKVLGINRFGYSAPAKAVYKELGLTCEQAKQTMLGLLHAEQVNN